MAGILKVDTIQNANADNIITQTNSTTLTIGASGDTVTLAAGATSSGFGATYNGAVNWDTTPKTSSPVTAVSGNGYFINTISGAITVNLPATPSAGSIVAIADYNGTAASNAITIGRNSSNINGAASNLIIAKNYSSVTLVYVDATSGWRSVDTSNTADIENTFVAATGGTVLTCGNYKTHVFTGPGSFVVTNAGTAAGSNSVEYLVVAGGGSGSYSDVGGGGGAGGFRQNYPSPALAGLPVTATTYPITVGAGGASIPGSSDANGNPGSNSIFSTITSAGGGGGGGINPSSAPSGGSGGGGRNGNPGGSGNTPPVSPPQGNNGGDGLDVGPAYGAGGGGGAGAVGSAGTTANGGAGGVGSYWPNALFGPTSPSYGTPGPVADTRYFAGGGGGGRNDPGTASAGGSGGGGAGAGPTATTGAGTTNTGGGGGGIGNAPVGLPSGAGGSGIVVIRYKYQ
jgi:hypothetical protein